MSFIFTMTHPMPDPKFTRGEKCIFVHIIVTFVMILTLVLIYFIHLLLIDHRGNEIFRISRKSNEHSIGNDEAINFEVVGAVYLNVSSPRGICNVLLLREQWSLAPAHCVSIRSDPEMAYFLPSWKIKYQIDDSNLFESDVKRGITHSHFNRDDFSNNIGLFQHESISGRLYSGPNNTNLYSATLRSYAHTIVMIGWNVASTKKGGYAGKTISNVQLMSPEKCSDYGAPIVENMRSYEFCVTFAHKDQNNILFNGALFAVNNQIIGFFSWGDKTGNGVPLIILNITQFTNWYENIMLY